MRFLTAAIATFVLVNLLAQTAAADIYSYVDESGISHFTNCPGLDERYKLVFPVQRDGADPKSSPSEAKKVDCTAAYREAQTEETSKVAPVQSFAQPNDVVTKFKPIEAPVQPLAYSNTGTDAKAKDKAWIWIGLLGLAALWLITQRWFWLVSFSVGGLAAFFAMVASVIHFQILAAVGFFIVAWICAVIAAGLADA